MAWLADEPDRKRARLTGDALAHTVPGYWSSGLLG